MKRWQFLTAVSAAQLALLLLHIGRANLWLDEVMSLNAAQGSWHGMLALFRSLPEQHPLYYLLLRGWLLIGTSEAALRLFSALLAVATVWALYFLVERVLDEGTARIAALLMALSPYLLYFGQEARMYALLGFLTVFNSYWFLDSLESDARGARAWYLGSAVCGVYTHLFFWFVILAQLVFVALRDWPRRAALVKVARAAALVVLAYLPWAVLLVMRRPETQSWKGAGHVVFGIPYALLRFSLGYSELLANAGWKERVPQLVAGNAGLLGAALVCFAVPAAVGCRTLWRTRPGGWFVLCGLAVPMAAAALASVVVILMGERYLMVSFPFYVTVLAAGWVGLFRAGRGARMTGVVLTALYVALLGRTLTDYYGNPAFGKEQWADVAQFLHANERPGDVIVVHSGFALSAFTHYYRTPGDTSVWPSNGVTPGQLDAADRLWLVLAHTDTGDEYWRPLTASHRIVIDRLFPHQSGIRVMFLKRSDRPG